MGTTTANQNQQTLFKMGIVEKEISFLEDKLLEFKFVQHSLKDYITGAFASTLPETDYQAAGLVWQDAFEWKPTLWHKEPGYLDSFLKVHIHNEAGYEEVAQNQIAGFEEFLKRRLEGAYRGLSQKEMRVIRKVEMAIASYRGYNCATLYNKFKRALAEYFIWLERKIKKSTSYLKYLNRVMSGSGVVVDYRRLLRAIMRFLCRRLDDEYGVNHKNSNSFSNYFFGLTHVNHEYRLYKSNN
jgi:hypothetical protein